MIMHKPDTVFRFATMRAPSMRVLFTSLVMGISLMTSVVIGGCTQAPVPQDRYYRISAPAPTSGRLLLPGAVEVDRFGAEGLTSGRAIVFVDGDGEDTLQEYNYDFWHKPPGDMLRDVLIDYLRASNVTNNFVTPEMRADADYLLTGRIQAFETVRGSAPKAIVVLEIAVTDAKTGAVRLVRSYRAEVPASNGSVKAAVAAVNQGVGDIFIRFLGDLRE